VTCPCGGNCQPRRLPEWLVAQLNDARSGLLAIAGIVSEGFLCPLCLRILPESCATLAHAPSKEVGGSGQTFLCKACNSFLGTAYEAAADEVISSIEEAKATGSVAQKITLRHRTGPHLYLDAVFSGSTDADRGITAEPIRRNPDAEKRFGDARKPGEPLFLTFRVPSEDHVKLAYLSWAFLLLFRRLGYAFIFSVSGRLARLSLLTGKATDLSPAYFFTYGEFTGEASPATTGLLVRAEAPDFDRFPPIAIGAEIGSTVIALPLTDDPLGAYGHLLEYTADDSRLLVLPFDEIYPDHSTAMPGIAAYRWQSAVGTLHRVLGGTRNELTSDLAAAAAPPSSRPKVRGPLRDNPDWPPPPLPLPPRPWQATWRATATEYVAARGVAVAPSASDVDDDAWIAELALVDAVAARHVADMRDLFLRGEDPRRRTEPRGVEVMRDLNRVAGEVDNTARVVAGDFRLVDPAEDFSSLSVRVLCGGDDLVVGPHYAYETLVFALRDALGAGSRREGRPTP
jgi:hypothetical protein